jgi:hypothetical protein
LFLTTAPAHPKLIQQWRGLEYYSILLFP